MACDIFSGKATTRDWSIGSFLLPAKEQARILDKLDDLRYDIRGTKGIVGAGVFALAGALAFLGVSSVYRTAKGRL